jgi:hypothetical protein
VKEISVQTFDTGGMKMNRRIIVPVMSLVVAMSMVLFSSGEGLAHRKTGMMGQGHGTMMGGRMTDEEEMDYTRRGLKTVLHKWARLLFIQRDQLGLTDEQLDEIQSLINAHMKNSIRKKAEQRILDIEVRELLIKEGVDLTEVENRITAVANLKAETEIDGVRTMEKIERVLSEEQQKKVKSLLKPLIFPTMGFPYCPNMTTEGGGMMGPSKGGMMEGMMGQQSMMRGGMMQGQAKTGVNPSSLTKTDAQGSVTIEVTFDPQEQRTQEELLFEVKMDTHSVELGEIDLGQLSVLRNEKGTEVNPSKWASPEEGGHHVAGSLVFPSVDPSGRFLLGPTTRSIELVVRGVGGIGERVFRWNL